MSEVGSEEWRPVVGYEGLYEVSNRGHVRRLPGYKIPHRRPIKPFHCPVRGYYQVTLSNAGRPKQWRIHKLVALAFLGPRPPGADINHIDGVKTNNCVANLEWASRSENARHAYRLGLKTPAPIFRTKKVNPDIVREIRKLAETTPYKEIGRRYGLCYSQICHIIHRRRWKHID